MKNSKAWMLVGVLAMVVLGGVTVGFYQSGGTMEVGRYTVSLLPVRDWGIGRQGVYGRHGHAYYWEKPIGYETKLLFVKVRTRN